MAQEITDLQPIPTEDEQKKKSGTITDLQAIPQETAPSKTPEEQERYNLTHPEEGKLPGVQKPTVDVHPQSMATTLMGGEHTLTPEESVTFGKKPVNTQFDPVEDYKQGSRIMSQAGSEFGRKVGRNVIPVADALAEDVGMGNGKPLTEEQAAQKFPKTTGTLEGVGGLAGGMATDPTNWAFAATGAEVGPVLNKLVSAAFAANMGKDTVEGAKQLGAEWDNLNPEQRAERITQLGLQDIFTGLAGEHAATGEYGAGDLVRRGNESIVKPAIRKTSGAIADTAKYSLPAIGAGLGTTIAAEAGVPHPYMLGGAAGAAAGRLASKTVTPFFERGKTFGMTPEEAAYTTLHERYTKSQKVLDEAQREIDHYKASKAQGVEPPEDVVKRYNKAKEQAAEDHMHASAALDALEKSRRPAPKEAPVAPEQPITPESITPKEVVPEQPAKVVPPINVKGPGEVRPEVTPYQEQSRPNVNPGESLNLPGGGVRVGKPKLLADVNPQTAEPKAQEVLPPEKPVKVGKPERGNVRALTVDEKGNVVDKEETPEGKLETLIREGLKPEKKSPLGKIATYAAEPDITRDEEGKPVEDSRNRGPVRDERGNIVSQGGPRIEQPRGEERRVSEEPHEGEERRKAERRVLKSMNEKAFQEGAFGGGEKPIDTDAYAAATEQARKELGPDATKEAVIARRNEIVGGEAPKGDIGEQARRANPEPTRAETKGPRTAEEYHPAVVQKISELSDDNLKKLAKAHSLDPDDYDFKARDDHRHRVERDQLANDIADQLGEDEKINLGRSAEQADKEGLFQGADTSAQGRAKRAEKVFPRLRGEVDEFGNPKVSGGAPDEEADKLKEHVAKTSAKDTDHVQTALKELGPDAKLSDVMKRAQELKENAAKPVDVSKSANDYNTQEKLPKIQPEKVEKDKRAAEIADDYAKMKHDPNDPFVKKSYDALVDDVKKQWKYAQDKMGIKFEPTDKDPYGFSGDKPAEQELFDDVKDNKTLKVWRGGNPLPEDHPLAKVDPETGETYNTMFRAVHDLFGHVAQGHDFSEPGEESAWNVHRQMMSPEAVPAMTTETRGQTSWFFNNEGVRGGEPLGKFAEQKAGLLPEYASERTPEAGKTLDHIKSGKDFAVLTAENPNNERISDQENVIRNRKLVSELREKGYNPVPVEGNTKDVEGQKEHSFFVPDISPKDAAEFGRNHGQAAILTNQGLHDLKTDMINPSDNAKVMVGEEARKQPYYSRVGDQDFSVPVDFDKRINTKGAPVDENGNPTVSGGSQSSEKKMPTPEQLLKKYGETDDPGQMAFLLKDGKGVAMPLGKIHDEILGGKATDPTPRREEFIKNEGAIRMRKSGVYGDRAFHISMPEDGISEAQLEKLKKMGPQMSTGKVYMEIANPTKDSAYRVVDVPAKDFAEAFDKNLRELVPVKNAQGAPIDEFGNPTVSGGSQSAAAPGKVKVGALPKLAEENLRPEEKAGVTKTKAGRDAFVKNLMDLPSVKEQMDIAKAGEGGKEWYQRSSKAFDHMVDEAPKYFTPEDKSKFLNMLASASPQQSVAMNMREALHVWSQYVDEGRPTGKALEKLLRDNVILPGAKVPNALKALNGEPLWPDLSKNQNFKVPSFGDNLNGDLDRATNDGWMALFNGLDAKDMSKATVYHAVSAVTRAAAKALGWETAEAQAAIWAFTKVFTEKGETDPKIIRRYSEDFADIMKHDPETRQLLQKNLGVDLGKLDTKLEGIGPKPKITPGASPSTENSIGKLAKRIEAARGKGTIPPPKSGYLGFDEEPDEATEFNPEKLEEDSTVKTRKSRLGKAVR